ncbi:hypothetical protein ACFWP7_16285 [Streptomyces sp. NPDC058470]|uniref:hypothetical protein n=1 Tax=Streptomyces sp. NPDC058470 TaxID=3346515 RepID=UPI003654E1C3
MPLPNGWRSSGPLHVGDGWGEYLHGDVDEVHVFSGVMTDSSIRQLGGGAVRPACAELGPVARRFV